MPRSTPTALPTFTRSSPSRPAATAAGWCGSTTIRWCRGSGSAPSSWRWAGSSASATGAFGSGGRCGARGPRALPQSAGAVDLVRRHHHGAGRDRQPQRPALPDRRAGAPRGAGVGHGPSLSIMRRIVYLLPILLFALLAGYFVLGLQRDPSLLPSALLDKPAPAFDLPGLGGKPGLATSDLAGQIVLVNFFASWCVPCREEHRLLRRLADEGNIVLYGVDYKDKPDDASRLLGQLGDPYRRIGVDREG